MLKKILLEKYKIVLPLLVVLLLLPTLVFPVFVDATIFIMMGDVILNGKTLYYDFIDIKPPLFYYIYALQNLIFGNTELSLRIALIVWQLATAFALYKFTKIITNHIPTIYITLISYIIFFVSLGFDNSITPEAYSLLPLLLISIVLSKEHISNINLIIAGILLSFLFGIKYTFGIYSIAFVIALYYKNQAKVNTDFIKKTGLTILGFIIFLPISFFAFFDKESLFFYVISLQYLKEYSSLPLMNTHLVIDGLIHTVNAIIKKTSILFFLLFLVPIWSLIKSKYKLKNTESNLKIELIEKHKSVIIFAIFVFIFGIISIIIERKLSLFHYVRLAMPMIILMPLGIKIIYDYLSEKEYFSTKKFIIITLFLLAFITLSPFPRYVKQLVITYGYFFDEPLYYSFYQGTEKYHSNKYLTYQKVSNYLLNLTKNEKLPSIIVSGIGANVINYNLNQKNKNIKLSKFSHSCFYSSKYEVDMYNTLFEEELQNADILVVSDSDLCYQISFHYSTTYYILKDRFAKDFSKFTQIKKIGEFRILRKIK